jgi:hypothetical protein
MKQGLLFLLLVTITSFKHPHSIKSNLYIPAGEKFHLGGGQNYPFRVEAKNVGLKAVELFLEIKGVLTPLGQLDKKEIIEAVIPVNNALVINNNNNFRAHLKVHVKGKSENLGMYYTNAQKE